MLSIRKSLSHRNILITGATGFVGKVLLEKILYEIPEVNKIYLLIRNDATERFHKEILTSKVFLRLQGARSDWEQYAISKVIPLNGDVLKESLGLDQDILNLIRQEIDVIVHCAATVDFRERLNDAMRKNIIGSVSLMELAKTFSRLQAFIHVSTAYVNCDRQGFHAEQPVPVSSVSNVLDMAAFDPEELVQNVLQMNPDEVERVTPSLIRDYPNTYTFTKALTELILTRHRGNVPLCFVRPTIIGCSVKDPVPGWIDSVSAVAAAVLYSGVGVIRFLRGDHQVVADVVPVDSVVNVILASIPATIQNRSGMILIYQVGTSHLNPVRWFEIARWVSTYWRQHNVAKRVDHKPLRFRFYRTAFSYNMNFFLRNELPTALYSTFANYLGTARQKRNAELLQKITRSITSISDAFLHFTTNNWVFGVAETELLMNSLPEVERENFFLGITEIDWEKYCRLFCYGMQRFVLHEDVKPPTDLLKVDLIDGSRRVPLGNEEFPSLVRKLFPDLSWAFSKSYQTNIGIDNLNTLRNPEETKALIIKSKKVQAAIQEIAQREDVSVHEIEARAKQTLDRMCHTLKLPVIRCFAWFFRKVLRQVYEGIHVDQKGIEMIRSVLTRGPLILIPTHRSYIDFLLISYIFYEFDLPIPHIAAGEDFLGILFVSWVFRNSGAFFIRRSFKGDILYIALFTEYVQRLVRDWSPIEFFIEGRRSRTGKTLHPKFGMFSICLEPLFLKKVSDIILVPISISYEKVMEAGLYSNELLGEKKEKESLEGLMRASNVLRLNFGRINVVFNAPLSAKDFIAEVIARRNLLPATDNILLANMNTQQEMLSNPMTISMNTSPSSSVDIIPTSSSSSFPAQSASVLSSISVSSSSSSPPSPMSPTIKKKSYQCNPYLDEEHRKELIQEFAYRVSSDLNKGLVVTATSLVATVILAYRKGITFEDLVTNVDWLREDIGEQPNGFVAYEGTTQDLVKHGLKLLENVVGKLRNAYMPIANSAGAKSNDKCRQCILVLDYYRNQLIHLYAQDGIIACALSSLLNKLDMTLDGIQKKDLVREASFLKKLLWYEFLNDSSQPIEESISKTIDSLVRRGFLFLDSNEVISMTSKGEGPLNFLCHFLWPLVDSYWITAISLFSLQPNLRVKKRLLLNRVQWIAEKMHSEGKLQFYESCSMEALSNTLGLFQKWKVICISESESTIEKSEKATGRSRGLRGRQSRRVAETLEDPFVQLMPPFSTVSNSFRNKFNSDNSALVGKAIGSTSTSTSTSSRSGSSSTGSVGGNSDPNRSSMDNNHNGNDVIDLENIRNSANASERRFDSLQLLVESIARFQRQTPVSANVRNFVVSDFPVLSRL